ncbi:MAG TPA: SMI1/KNR4 family protein [Bacillota bacterium]|nr:SMI1/KNR4 family protein [Bacillota bacterium]
MIAADLKQIEESLNITLPEYYKKVVLNYPFLKKITELLDDPIEIIRLNKLYRENGLKKTEWPENLYIFGSRVLITKTGEDDIYFLNSSDPEENVYIISKGKPFQPDKLNKYKQFGGMKFHIDVTNAVRDVLKKE